MTFFIVMLVGICQGYSKGEREQYSNFNRSVGLEIVAMMLDNKNITEPLRSVVTNDIDVDHLIIRKSGMDFIKYHTMWRPREFKD